LSDLDIIETELLSIDAIINRSFAKGTAMLTGKGMIYTDEEVAHLPSIGSYHPHYKEWKRRERSTKRLLKLAQQAGAAANILQVGCGNGWLAAKLANATSGNVTGIDINMRDLRQAKRVFAGSANLDFFVADISEGILSDKQFDIIVFAASIQYCSSLKAVIKNAMEHLTLMGQIHILDSPLHAGKNIPAKIMDDTDQHIHHIAELESFQYKIIYDPAAWSNKLFVNRDPFRHIVIKNHYR